MNMNRLSVKTNNGFHAAFFPISRGIRQGCPISALLFIMCAEVLAIAIREQQNINGIVVSTKKIIFHSMQMIHVFI